MYFDCSSDLPVSFYVDFHRKNTRKRAFASRSVLPTGEIRMRRVKSLKREIPLRVMLISSINTAKQNHDS